MSKESKALIENEKLKAQNALLKLTLSKISKKQIEKSKTVSGTEIDDYKFAFNLLQEMAKNALAFLEDQDEDWENKKGR